MAQVRQQTDNVVKLRTPLDGASPTALDRRRVEDLEVRAAAAATYAALSVAIDHWTAHGGDLAAHIRVALRGCSRGVDRALVESAPSRRSS